MRSALILPATALVLGGAIVLIGGRMVSAPAVFAPPPASATLAPEPPAIAAASAPAAVPAPPRPAPAASRLVAPKAVTPLALVPDELQREPPRAPLGELGLAQPPAPEIADEWNGKAFYRPVAVESAVFESMGRRIEIAGTRSVALGETCDADGVSWRCGVRARTAFRLWLRGRALLCDPPEESDAAVIATHCRLGKQDVGAWLVSNGWARAVPGGPYAQAGDAAQKAGMGIFGAPPDTSGVSAVPDIRLSAPLLDQPVLAEPGADAQPQADPGLEFPPAPPAPSSP